jgi:acyl carrier protein
MLNRNGFKEQFIFNGLAEKSSDIAIILADSTRKIDDLKFVAESEMEIIEIESYMPKYLAELKAKYRDAIFVVPSYLKENIEEVETEINCRNAIDREIVKMIRQLLAIEIEDIAQSFYEVDIDSLSALMLCSKIKEHFKIQFTMRDLMECPCVLELADKVSEIKNN